MPVDMSVPGVMCSPGSTDVFFECELEVLNVQEGVNPLHIASTYYTADVPVSNVCTVSTASISRGATSTCTIKSRNSPVVHSQVSVPVHTRNRRSTSPDTHRDVHVPSDPASTGARRMSTTRNPRGPSIRAQSHQFRQAGLVGERPRERRASLLEPKIVAPPGPLPAVLIPKPAPTARIPFIRERLPATLRETLPRGASNPADLMARHRELVATGAGVEPPPVPKEILEMRALAATLGPEIQGQLSKFDTERQRVEYLKLLRETVGALGGPQSGTAGASSTSTSFSTSCSQPHAPSLVTYTSGLPLVHAVAPVPRHPATTNSVGLPGVNLNRFPGRTLTARGILGPGPSVNSTGVFTPRCG
jgi:hypothetical protein